MLAATVSTAERAWFAPRVLVAFAVLAVGSAVVLRGLLLFDWRGQRVSLATDEVLVVVALALLPAPLVVLFAVVPMALFQRESRRGFVRGAFNVGNLVLSTSLAVGVFLLASGRFGAPFYLAAAPALIAYNVSTHAFVSAVFALRERASVVRVYRERFLPRLPFNVALGLAGGVLVLSLVALSPLALLALAPVAWLAIEHRRATARAERARETHRRLAELPRGLAGVSRAGAVATRLVAASAEMLRAGRVILTRAGGRVERRFGDGPRANAAPLVEPIPAGPGGDGGSIAVVPAASTKEDYSDDDREVLRAIAGAASSAFANAQALSERVAAIERERELTRLKDLDAVRQAVFRMVAHDLGTPLTPIALRLKLLKNSARLGDAERRGLDVIERNVDRITALTHDLIDAVRLDANRIALVPAPVDLDVIARATVESFADVAAENGVEMVAAIAGAGVVEADASRINQVLYNLVSNALKFTPQGGRVTVATRREDDVAVIAVSDTGRGLSAEALARLFAPFSRPGAADIEGTGLGLYVSHAIAQLSGGSLVAESGGAGLGATFTLRLPIGGAPRPLPVVAAPAPNKTA
ncbi:MAG: sensor histidine kinase [Thermoplasmatota archaeon]